MKELLALCRNEPVDGIGIQPFTMAAKSSSTGPLFHCRVSKRYLAVFQRRWIQTKSAIA